VSLVFGSVHGLTLGFGSTLIGETVDYAIYYLIQARGAGVAGTGWQRWRDLNWPTVRLGLLTSVCGFAALVFSGFPGLAQLGVFSIAGLVAAALATRYVLPMLAPDGATGMGMRRHMAQVAGMLVRGLPRLRWPLAALGVVALGLVLWQGGHLWRADLGAMSPVPKSAQQLDEMLRNDIGASDGGVLVVAYGDDEQAALRNTEAAAARSMRWSTRANSSATRPSRACCPARPPSRRASRACPMRRHAAASLAEATQGLPLPASRLGPFLADVEAARKLAPCSAPTWPADRSAPVVNTLMYQRPVAAGRRCSCCTPADVRPGPARSRAGGTA
jgi:predicted exporter